MSILIQVKSLLAGKLGRHPRSLLKSLLASSFNDDYGHFASVKLQKPIDRSGNPMPWFTYPAIEYLDSLDLSKANVFEWGSGNSTAYLASRCSSIESVQSDEELYKYQKPMLKPNQLLHWKHKASDQYYRAIAQGSRDI